MKLLNWGASVPSIVYAWGKSEKKSVKNRVNQQKMAQKSVSYDDGADGAQADKEKSGFADDGGGERVGLRPVEEACGIESAGEQLILHFLRERRAVEQLLDLAERVALAVVVARGVRRDERRDVVGAVPYFGLEIAAPEGDGARAVKVERVVRRVVV